VETAPVKGIPHMDDSVENVCIWYWCKKCQWFNPYL